MKNILTVILIAFCFAANARAQTEILSNETIILLTKAGLSSDLIARKIKDSSGRYDTTAQALIELKKAGVAEEIIRLMLDDKDAAIAKNPSASIGANQTAPPILTTQPIAAPPDAPARIVLGAREALHSAKTVAIEKSTINPSRQALEKELLKRADWQKLNLNIVRVKESADLRVEIGFVPFSIITHRYVFRVYDRRSGTVIAAGETTSWGSLAENLAREISKKLKRVSTGGV